MKKIKLTQGKFAIVDNTDFYHLSKYKWYYSHGYAMRDTQHGRIYLHREVVNCPKNMEVDHINRDRLDDRLSNLRVVTHQQNHFNTGLQKNNTTGHKGIVWLKRRLQWRAQIKHNKKMIYLGCFNDVKSAILARQQAEQKYHAI